MDHWKALQNLNNTKAECSALNSTDVDAIEWAVNTLNNIKSWCDAYPVKQFPEPDFARANEVLKAEGISLSAISGSNMRHVCTGIAALIEAKQHGY